MILILGGTTEGRIAVKVIDEAGKPYYYSTKGNAQQIVCKNGVRIAGTLTADDMEAFCKANGIRLLIDAAHPFAERLHQTIHEMALRLPIPTIRFERIYPPHSDGIVWCKDYQEAIQRLEEANIDRLLILTGVQTIAKLKPYWVKHLAWVRVLEREESIRLAAQCGFPTERLLFYHADEDESALFKAYMPQAILTKESGESGGFVQKREAAHSLGIPLYVVKRPLLPEYSMTVNGQHGLRRAVETLLPDFYPLRSGFTTGACATAAAKAALWVLLSGDEYTECPIHLPDGEVVNIPITRTMIADNQATAIVVKDAGDDPDITHGCEIGATVSLNGQGEGVHFLPGEGVGTVTLPGLGLPVGSPAINPVPREMIRRELTSLYQGGIEVEIFVPKGRELAKRTFNPKLGIKDGISIIGTSGIVRPFSSEAFVDAIRREIEVCKAVGASPLVINSGAKSERYLKQEYPHLPPHAFVHYGNFIGETLKAAASLGMKEVVMGIMLGKAVKLAEGYLDTHSKQSMMNKKFLQQVATEAGCSARTREAIDGITLARELWTLIPDSEQSLFFPLLLHRCYAQTAPLLPGGHLSILLIDEEGHIPYRIG